MITWDGGETRILPGRRRRTNKDHKREGNWKLGIHLDGGLVVGGDVLEGRIQERRRVQARLGRDWTEDGAVVLEKDVIHHRIQTTLA